MCRCRQATPSELSSQRQRSRFGQHARMFSIEWMHSLPESAIQRDQTGGVSWSRQRASCVCAEMISIWDCSRQHGQRAKEKSTGPHGRASFNNRRESVQSDPNACVHIDWVTTVQDRCSAGSARASFGTCWLVLRNSRTWGTALQVEEKR